MAREKVLLPYNFSESDQKAIDFAVRTFSPRAPSVVITLFHAYMPLPKIETSKGTVMEKLTDGMKFVRNRIDELETEFKQVKDALVENGFPPSNVKMVFRAKHKDIASEIIDQARKGGHAIIILNRKPGRVARFFTGTVFQKVVSNISGKTVCIVS